MYRRPALLSGCVAALVAAVSVIMPGPASAAGKDTRPPTVPSNVRTTTVSFTWVSLAWEPSTDNSARVSYEVRVVTPTGIWTSSTIATTQSFGGFNAGTTYTATVRAIDAAGNSSATTSATFTTSPRTTPPPGAPLNLRGVFSGGTLSALTWDAPAYHTGVHYALYSGSALIAWVDGTSVTISHLVDIECVLVPWATYTLTVQSWAPDNYAGAHSNALTITVPNA
jgi:hypothetical protein